MSALANSLRPLMSRALLGCLFALAVSGPAFSQSVECPITSSTTVSEQVTLFLGSAPSCIVQGSGTNFTVLTVANGGALLNTTFKAASVTMIIDSNGELQNSGYFQNFGTTSTAYVGSTVTNFGAIYNNATGTLDTTDGTLTNAGNLENFGTLDDETGGGGTLNNAGRLVNEEPGTINVTNVTNAVGASIENDSNFQASSLTNNSTFSNLEGDLTLTGSSTNNGTLNTQNYLAISGQFQNNGTLTNGGFVTVLSGGSLNLAAGSTLTNDFANLDLNGGSLNNLTGGTLALGGEVIVNGTMNAGPGVQLYNSFFGASVGGNGAGAIFGSGGVLFGTGTINGSLVNDSIVAPGSAVPVVGLIVGGVAINDVSQFTGTGTLTINGNYTQGADGVLDIVLGGVGAGNFSVLDVSGLASLDGAVQFDLFNGFTPVTGDDFTFLFAGALSGDFLDPILDGWSCPTGDTCDLVYGANSVSLDITAASSGGSGGNGGSGGTGGTGGSGNTPEPSTLLLLGAALLALVGCSRAKRISANA